MFQKFLLCDFLDYNRLRNECLKLANCKFNIEIEINETLELCSLNAKKKSIRLELFSELTLEQKEILNDQNRIKQLIINFVGNSIKFQKQGVIKVIL